MKYFFTSDLHLGHANIIKHCNRPFKDVEEMNESLINNWNSVVGSDDFVYVLGDFFFFGKVRAMDTVKRLNGAIYWIVGNHDRGHVKKKDLLIRFEGVDKLKNIRIKCILERNGGHVEFDKKMVLCHFPLLSWEGSGGGSWHLHGHCHGSLDKSYRGLRMDVGVDTHPGYRPYGLEEIIDYMSARKAAFVDHHKGEDHARDDV